MLHRHHITEMLNAISNAICVSARARARFGKDGFYVSAHSKPNDLLEYKVLHISQSKVLCVLKQLMLYSHSCATSSKDALSFVDSLSCYCLGQGDLCYRQTLATHSTYYAQYLIRFTRTAIHSYFMLCVMYGQTSFRCNILCSYFSHFFLCVCVTMLRFGSCKNIRTLLEVEDEVLTYTLLFEGCESLSPTNQMRIFPPMVKFSCVFFLIQQKYYVASKNNESTKNFTLFCGNFSACNNNFYLFHGSQRSS